MPVMERSGTSASGVVGRWRAMGRGVGCPDPDPLGAGPVAEGRREESLGGGDGSTARRSEGRRRGDEDGAEELRAAAIGRLVRTPPDPDGIERRGLTSGSGGAGVRWGLGFRSGGVMEVSGEPVGPVGWAGCQLGRLAHWGGPFCFFLFFLLPFIYFTLLF